MRQSASPFCGVLMEPMLAAQMTLGSLGSAVLRLASSTRTIALLPSVTDVRLTTSVTPRGRGAEVIAEVSAILRSHGPFAGYLEVGVEEGQATVHAVIDLSEQVGFLWQSRSMHAQTIEDLVTAIDNVARELCAELERQAASLAKSV